MDGDGKNLREFRERMGLTQGVFAQWLNERLDRKYDKALVSRWETCNSRIPVVVANLLFRAGDFPRSELKDPGLIVTVSNQKGGVGKTVTVVNVAYLLASEGKRVLVVDCDPQANASLHFGINAHEAFARKQSISLVLFHEHPIRSAITKVCDDAIDLIPSGSELREADGMLTRDPNGILALREKLDELRDDYDFILIDTPPTTGVLMISSFNAADYLLIPTQTEMMSFDGISKIMEDVAKVRRRINPALTLLGILPNLYKPQREQDRLILPMINDLGPKYKTRVFTPINDIALISKGALSGRPTIEMYPRLAGVEGYREVVTALLAAAASRKTANGVSHAAA